MPGLLLVLLATLTVAHWILQPFAALATPVLNLSWLGWALLAGFLWLFAGERRSP
ncbi:MAG: hypothetical protein ACKO25_12495 [Cyanobium sp.]